MYETNFSSRLSPAWTFILVRLQPIWRPRLLIVTIVLKCVSHRPPCLPHITLLTTVLLVTLY